MCPRCSLAGSAGEEEEELQKSLALFRVPCPYMGAPEPN